MSNRRLENELDLQLEPLENRLLLAADWTANGDSLKIIADEANDTIVVSQSSGNVMVQVSEGGIFEDTGIANLQKLIINTGDGSDSVDVDIDSSKLVKINLGAGDDTLRFGGSHKKGVAIGGKGDDLITMAGVTVGRGRIVGGADNDTVGFDFLAYSFGDLNGLSESRVTITLGAGEDAFQLMAGETIVGEDNIADIGFAGVETVPELLDTLSGAGFGDALKGFRIIGGRDTDSMLGSGAIDLVSGLEATIKTFEVTTFEAVP